MTLEEWRPVVGYEGIYEVSSHGRVRRVTDAKTGGHKAGRLMAARRFPNGYLGAALSKDGRCKYPLRHRLVAEAFIPNPSGKRNVNHIDGDRTNNRVDNLEWVTQKENVKHAMSVLGVQYGSRGEENGKTKLTEKQVREIRRRYESGEATIGQMARELNTNWMHVGRIAKRQRWDHI